MKVLPKSKKGGTFHHCPICGTRGSVNPRYPRYLCQNCADQATDEKGRLLEFFNEGFSGGFIARYVKSKRSRNSHVCFIGDVRCWADEARLGGIVIETRTVQESDELERERLATRTGTRDRARKRTEGERILPSQIDRARQRVITAFTKHWRQLLRSRKSIAKDREDEFFAGSPTTRARLARAFYSRKHVRQMADLSGCEVERMLQTWLEHALQSWLNRYGKIGETEGDDFLDKLPTAEYVTIFYPHASTGKRWGFPGGPLIDRLPGEHVLYDDLYERMLAGTSIGGVLRIYKSTGERIAPAEMRSMRAGIRQHLIEGGRSAGDDPVRWALNMNFEEGKERKGFEDEDLHRVVMVEANDFRGDLERD